MKRTIEGKSASNSPVRSRTDSDTQQAKKDSSQIQQEPNLDAGSRRPMQFGSTEACLEAFRRSNLRQFGYVGCSVEPVPTASMELNVANAKALFAPYFELFAGLAAAPHLHTLEIGGEDTGAIGELAALAAFARNPSATTVRCCEAQGVKVSRFVEILNRKRKGNGLPPLVLELAIKADPEHNFYPILLMNKADRRP